MRIFLEKCRNCLSVGGSSHGGARMFLAPGRRIS